MSEQTLLDAALAYAAHGWHVFPCHTPTATGCSCRKKECADIGKHPRTQHGLKDATTDEATITRWWGMWPNANVAIRTGAVSNAVVLDDDSYKGGDESLSDLEHTYTPLPETVQQLTGGGGVQYLFAHPGTAVKNGVESLGQGLDIRGDGGYVIVPPSLHKSGKRYAWEILHEPEETALAPMPDWLLALCQESTRRDAPDAGAPIPQGQRNDTLFRMGCSLRAKGLTEAVILVALREMNATQCQPPLTEEEIGTLAASCAKYAPGTRREDLSQHRNGTATGAEDASEDAPDLSHRLQRSEYSNVRTFVQAHGEDVRWCEDWKCWLAWTGTHWQRDTSGVVLQKAKSTVKAQLRAVELTDDENAITAILRHVNTSLKIAQLEAMVKNANSEPGMRVTPAALDTHPWLLNCANGTLDLRTGKLRPHSKADMLTQCLPVPYEKDALCTLWDTFLARIMDKNTALISFLQRAIGYALTGVIREHVLIILWGKGRNGKSTFLNLLRALLGGYAMKAPSELLMVSHNDRHPTERADLYGKRFVAAIETEQGRRLAEVFVKEATGGDPIRARRMREDFWEFQPTHKVFLATNHKPLITGTDDAIWERIKPVPFTVTFTGTQQDTTLPEKLQAELPGILAWAVRGCQLWQREGLGEPDEVTATKATYRAEMDVLGQFIKECCRTGDNYRVKASELYEAYTHWSGDRADTQRTWGMALTERAYERKRGTGGNFWWLGIALAPPESQESAEKDAAPLVNQVNDSEPKNGINSSLSPRGEQTPILGSLGSLGSLTHCPRGGAHNWLTRPGVPRLCARCNVEEVHP